MLLLQTAAVLALATGLAAPVQAAEVDTTRGSSLTIAFAEDDAADVQKSIVADLSRGGVRQFDAELYRVGSYTTDGSLITEPDFAELDLENVVAEALAAYEKQQQEAEANPTPTPTATEDPAEPTPQPTPDNGHIPGSVWQGVWDEKAAQAVKLIQQKRLEPATTVQINYETCTDTTARYTGTAGNLVCGMYLVRLPALNGAAYRYSAKDYLVSVPYNASLDLSMPQTQPDVWEYEVTSYPKLDRRSYPSPDPTPTPRPTLEPDEEDTPATPGIGPWHLPKTGDSSQPLLWLVLMLAAGTGLILVLVKKHKENGGQKK